MQITLRVISNINLKKLNFLIKKKLNKLKQFK